MSLIQIAKVTEKSWSTIYKVLKYELDSASNGKNKLVKVKNITNKKYDK